MNLEKRVADLQQRGNTEMARRLVRGVIGSADLEDVTITQNEVQINHDRFSGTHRIVNKADGKIVKRRGDYEFTGLDGSLEITLTASNSELIELVEDQLASNRATRRQKIEFWK